MSDTQPSLPSLDATPAELQQFFHAYFTTELAGKTKIGFMDAPAPAGSGSASEVGQGAMYSSDGQPIDLAVPPPATLADVVIVIAELVSELRLLRQVITRQGGTP